MRFKIFVLKLLGISRGPWMIPVRDYWIFIDSYQKIYKIKYTGRYDYPLEITLWER